jgi:hypothetical protein
MPAKEIAKALGLAEIRDHEWQITACSAKENKDKQLEKGVQWLLSKTGK